MPDLTPPDLTLAELGRVWQIMRGERLTHIFFHDGAIRDLTGFVRYATDRNTWFHLAEHNGEPLGFGVVNGFTSSGTSGFAHFCCFAQGRNGLFREAALRWLALLERAGLRSLVAVTPASYRGALRWIRTLGFAEAGRLPGALRIVRPHRGQRRETVGQEHATGRLETATGTSDRSAARAMPGLLSGMPAAEAVAPGADHPGTERITDAVISIRLLHAA